jgi:glycosyltransferase involved in cell wall biosynthesis
VLIWENTQDDLLAHAAARLGLKVIALPHDLVALNRATIHEPWRALAREVRGLAGSDQVITIALEERWLLRLLGCPARWLPYYPPAAVEASLRRARLLRRPAAHAPILILGSTANPQTRAGLEHQLQLLRAAGPIAGRRVVLAGNGTADLTDLAGKNIEVRGAVSDGELTTLMAEAAVLWTYQAAGTGALTRIVEALIAGVPVAGGGVALRSTAHLAHVYPAETVAELAALLPSLPAVAAQPARPTAAEQEFIGQVKALA